ncbi:MAG: hypothetical protein E6G54_04895 [Actinobacteria bacterium]|nr:MAG: hypothetical protein E6G54_04895 [Actinomycetota bacterium]
MDKLDRLGWVVQQSYRFDAALVGIRSTSVAFADWVSHALEAYRVDEDASPAYSIVVADPPERDRAQKRVNVLYKSTRALVRTLSLRTLGRGLLADLGFRGVSDRTDAIYLRGAIVVAGGTVALVPRSIGTGLDRVSRRLHRKGVVVGPTAMVCLDPEAGALVPGLPDLATPSDTLPRLEALAGADPPEDRLFVDRPTPIDVVVVQTRERGERIRSTSRASAVYGLTRDIANVHVLGNPAMQGVARLAEGARCYEWHQPGMDGLDELLTVLQDPSANDRD